MSPVRQLKLHVKLQAPGPGERFAVLGSHEALGCWNPTSGLQLEWKGHAWETPDPIAISPCERVEFKFVRVRLGGVEWESGPNRVTEFPNFKGELCLQGIFNGETILQPTDSDFEVPGQNMSAVESIHKEDELWKHRYEEALSVLMGLQKNIASRQEEHDRRRARHREVASELRQQISVAQDEAEQLTQNLKEGLEGNDLQSNLAPDIATIPSPSFASSASCASTPARSVGRSSTSSLRRNPGLHFKSQRGDFGKTTAGPKAMPSAPAPPRGPIGRLSSVLEGMNRSPAPNTGASAAASASAAVSQETSKVKRSGSKSETTLAALRAARGASPVSPPSEDETVQSEQASGQQSASCSWSRSESALRGPVRKYERVLRTAQGAEEQAEGQEDEAMNTVIASKEVVAALATARARYDEVGSREDSRS